MTDGLALLDPGFLLVIPLVLVVLLARLTRERAALPSASLALLDGLPRTLRARLARLPEWLRALALIALALALARPVTRALLPLRQVGVDIVVAMDVSSSMTLPDMDEALKKTRMSAAREQAIEFVQGRHNDRIAVLTFAKYADLRCPPTLDRDAATAFLKQIETVTPNSPEDRTAIGVGLARAVQLLEGSDAKSRVVVLLSDGENNQTEVPPEKAAQLAKDANVRVHAIGIGRGQPVRTFTGEHRLEPLKYEALRHVSEHTGGKFFEARSANKLGEVWDAIDAMEKVELEDPRYRTKDHFLWPMAAGAALLLLALLLETLWIRGSP